MLLLDQYAYANPLRNTHPAEKALLALFTMAVAIFSKSIVNQLIIATVMSAVIVAFVKIPAKLYARLLVAMLLFAALGVIPMLVALGYHQGQGIKLMIDIEGVRPAALVLARSTAAVTCLLFLSLTTPLIDLIELLRYIKIPTVVIEIAALIYRFIFVLLAASMDIYHSQSARLGYSSFGSSLKSLGKLISMVFIKAYANSQALYIALVSRGYERELRVLNQEYTLNRKNLAGIVLAEILLTLLAIALEGY